MPFVAILPLLGYTYLLRRYFNKPLELLLLVSLTTIIVGLYALALLELLKPGVHVIFYGGLFAFVWFTYRALQSKAPLSELWPPAITVLVLACAGYWLLFNHARLFFWDEFSHWGLAAKVMHHQHALYDNSGTVLYPHYPPAAALWIYFVGARAAFSESAALAAQFMLLLVPMTTLFGRLSYRHWGWLVGIALLVAFLVANLGHGVACLYVDHILGALLGGVVIAYLPGKHTSRELMLFSAPLCVLALTKDIGLFLACGAALFMGLHHALVVERETGIKRARSRWMPWIAVLLLCLAPLAAAKTWQLRLNRLGISGGESADFHLSEVWKNPPSAHQKEVAQRFLELFLHQQMSKNRVSYGYNEFSYPLRSKFSAKFRLSAYGWCLLSLSLFVPAFLLTRMHRCTLGLTFFFLLALFLLYSLMLLIMYVFIFSPKAALRLASYVRYYNIVILPMVMVAAGLFVPATGILPRPSPRHLGGIVFAGLLVFFYTFERPYVRPLMVPLPEIQFRTRLAAARDRVLALVPPDKSLYVVFPVRGNGFYRVLLRYELAPLRIGISGPDLEPKSAAELLETFGAYDYVCCLVCPPELVSKYPAIFKASARGQPFLYRVLAGGEGPRLEPLP